MSGLSKGGLWDKLLILSNSSSTWIVLGDFNVVRSVSEREGPNPPATQDILGFNACLAQFYSDDMHRMGSEFTWSNKQGADMRTWARLDRVLVNPESITMFLVSFALGLPPGPSDHSPCSSLWFPLVQSKGDLVYLMSGMITLIIRVLWRLLGILLVMKAKVHNIKKGDCPSSFFFSKIALRKYYSTIGMIKDKDDITRYGIESVPDEEGGKLIASVTREDIRKALFSISSSKSPGQDGFSSGFFKKSWDTVDIKKAFDSLQWNFIQNMLQGVGFHGKFVTWVMGCIASTWFSLKINGDLCGFFPGKSGVRQRDPLSPYIFVLSLEILSRQLRRLSLLHQVSLHPKCAKLRLNHLIFADDLMILMRGDVPSVVVVVARYLDEFAKVSGLHANPAKTSI
ncbi:uncharacterized protein LOC141608385 [Silene latifolia]|uniref:uncharacterized protein LOC141608385 n=1 Tax=Silene latifolia TaxID=37657 RepID=UPI003D77F0BD